MAYLLNQPYDPATNPDAPIPPEMLARKRQFGESMLQTGMDTSPIRSPWQGAARLAQALMGGLAVRSADTKELGYRSQAAKDLADALTSMNGGGAAPELGAATAPSRADFAGRFDPVGTHSVTPSGAGAGSPGAGVTPGMSKLMSVMMNPYGNPVGQAVASSIMNYRLMPHQLVSRAPGAVLVDPYTGQPPAGGSSYQKGDGSPYDLEQASKAYDSQFGPAANRAINAPDFQSWYKAGWPTFGTDQGGPPAAAGQGEGGLPKRGVSEADTLRWDRASNAAVKNYIENPAYKLVANGAPFLTRIDAAAKLPGSAVNDQELLDSITKLNTGGGQVTEAQVNLVTKGGSLTDKINIWKNMMGGQGGVLSPAQRAELVTLAHRVFGEYQKLLIPYYQDATRKLKAQGVPEEYWTIPDVATLSKQAGIADETSGGGDSLSQAKQAIAAGVPREEVIRRMQENGLDPSGL